MVADTEFLKTVSYFEGLSDDDINHIRSVIFEKSYKRGDIIIYEGDVATGIYFVVSGVIKIFKTSVDGKEQILQIIRPGESFNDVPVFDGGVNPSSAQAMGDAVIYELGKSDLVDLLHNHPDISENTIKVLAQQVRQLLTLVEDLSFRNVIGRVAKILLQYAQEEPGDGPRLTQQEMAAMAGSAREVVGRSLKSLEEDGIIRLNRQKISITDKDALVQMVEALV